jgi:hypothetical protein
LAYLLCWEAEWGVWAHNVGGGCHVESLPKGQALETPRRQLIVAAWQERSRLLTTGQDSGYHRNVIAARIHVTDAKGTKSTLPIEVYVSDSSARRPSYLKGANKGKHSEDFLLERLQELKKAGYRIDSVEAFSERNVCTRCLFTEGGVVDLIHEITVKGKFRVDNGVFDHGLQKEISTARNPKMRTAAVDPSREFLKQWWEEIGSLIK